MKTLKQIQDRITFLESRQKDRIDVSETLLILNWALLVQKEDVIEEILNTAEIISNTSYWQKDITYMRDLLWVLED